MAAGVFRPRDSGLFRRRPRAAALARRKADQGGGLYQKRVPIYPKLVHGKWRTIKWAMLIATLAVYYVVPWIRWTRPGDLPDQAVLVDMGNARLFFFWFELWPQEIYFLTGVLQSISTRTSAGISDYVLYSFRLIDTRTSEIVWEDSAEIKKQGLEDAVYR